MTKKRLAVLIGSGSRLPPIYRYTLKAESPFELVLVVSYKRESAKIAWAKKRGIPAFYHRWIDYKRQGKTREKYNEDLVKLLKKYKVDLVFGVGWDIIWTANLLQAFPDRVLNAHPFPLPHGPDESIIYKGEVIPVLRGMGALKKAWEMKLPITGACVHFARETVDVGPVITSEVMPIKPGESLESLEKRHLNFEMRVLVKALQLIAENRITIVDERVVIKQNKPISRLKLKGKKVLVIGSGGREHALVWKLAQSKQVGKIFSTPGNVGTGNLAKNVAIEATDVKRLLQFAQEKQIDLTVVGPENPLAAGIVDRFIAHGLSIFGPSQAAARLESSKAWSDKFMQRHKIPHPQFKIFDDVNEAKKYVRKPNGDCVVKADGLALGKGVFVCKTVSQAQEALNTLMVAKAFGSAGEKVVIQERLEGREASVMVFSDGKRIAPIIPAQDYKRVFDHDQGPNTGGMGSYAPNPAITPTVMKKIIRLMNLAIQGMQEEGNPYIGILYAGLMLVNNEPYLLEFNCRFGDPETQAQIPLLKTDLLTIMESCINGSLAPDKVTFSNNACICVVLASGGYPGEYQKGKEIKGLDKLANNEDVIVFHAATIKSKGKVVTNGGRVLGITALGQSLNLARQKAYSLIGNPISFAGMHYRKDIGI